MVIKVGDIYLNTKGEKCVIKKIFNFGGRGKHYLVWFPLTNQYQYVFHSMLVRKSFVDSSKPCWNGCFSKGTLNSPAYTSDPDGRNVFYMWKMLINRRNAITKEIYISPEWFDHMNFRRWVDEKYSYLKVHCNTISNYVRYYLCTEVNGCFTPDTCFLQVDLNSFFGFIEQRELAQILLENHEKGLDDRNVEYLNRIVKSDCLVIPKPKVR